MILKFMQPDPEVNNDLFCSLYKVTYMILNITHDFEIYTEWYFSLYGIILKFTRGATEVYKADSDVHTGDTEIYKADNDVYMAWY